MKQVSHGLHRFAALVLSLASLFLMAGCNLNTRMSTFDTKGPVAETQLDLFMITVWVSTFIFIVVGGALDWAVFKYR